MSDVLPHQLSVVVASELEAFQRAAVVESVTQLLRGLTRHYPPSPGIPVDTGWHRSGWRVGAPVAPTDALPRDLGSYPIPGDDVPVDGLRDWQPGMPFEAASNTGVPDLLQLGRSQQAPDGFVDQAIAGSGDRMRNWVWRGGAA